MAKIPAHIGEGGSYVNTDLYKLLAGIADDLAALKAAFEVHTHRYEEGSATAATQKVTTSPANLATSGSVTALAAGEQQTVTITTTK